MYDLLAQLFVFLFALVYAVILVGMIILWMRKGRTGSKRRTARPGASSPNQSGLMGPSSIFDAPPPEAK